MRQVLGRNASNHEESRYSSQEMERIIVKAAVMDAKREELLTEAQIEEIALQQGISLASVRRVLAEEHSTQQQVTLRRPAFPSAQFAALAIAPLWAVVASALTLHLDWRSRYAALILFVLPCALCFIAGISSRRKRIALVSGALIGIATMIGCTIGWGAEGLPGAVFLGAAFMAGAGAVAAALGSALRAMAFSSHDSMAPAPERN
jgi:hypothetical protein